MKGIKAETILEWTRGVWEEGEKGVEIKGVSIDTRTLRPGDLFVALPGKNHDGHRFVPEAFRRGASGALVSRPFGDRLPSWGEGGGFVIRVEDPAAALTALARSWRQSLGLKVVAITGSNGKTTTKDLAGRLLGAFFPVAVAPASFNNRLGVSLSLLKAEPDDAIAVLELGMNRPGEIAELGGICRPDLGVILNVGPAHLGFFPGLKEIALAKGELLASLEGDRIAVLNFDDRRVRDLGKGFSGRTVGFGLRPAADFRAEEISFGPDGVDFDFVTTAFSVRLQSPLPGLHNLYNCLAALTVASLLGVPADRLGPALTGACLPPLRMEKKRIAGLELVIDAYNANPASMRAALTTWLEMPFSGRRIMVSGDMAELGKFSRREHRLWGEKLAASQLDYLMFVGDLSRTAAQAAAASGFPSRRIFEAADCRRAAAIIKEIARPGDSVLIKGSRVLAMEEIVKFLEAKANKESRCCTTSFIR